MIKQKPSFSAKAFSESLSFYLQLAVTAFILVSLYKAPGTYSYLKQLGAMPHLGYLWLVVAGYLYSFGIFQLTRRYCFETVKRNLVSTVFKPNETTDQRTLRICNDINGFIYYSSSLITGFIVLWGSEFMPRMLGGTLDLSHYPRTYPLPQPTPAMLFYFLMGFGHHVERFFELLIYKKDDGSFWLFYFHHLITVALMGISFYTGKFCFGLPVLILHDMIEPVMNLSKFSRELRPFLWLKVPVFGLFTLVWIFSRTICFTFDVLIYMPLMYFSKEPKFEKQEFYITAEIFCLYMLWIVNQFWLYQILQIGYRKIRYNTEATPSDKKE